MFLLLLLPGCFGDTDLGCGDTGGRPWVGFSLQDADGQPIPYDLLSTAELQLSTNGTDAACSVVGDGGVRCDGVEAGPLEASAQVPGYEPWETTGEMVDDPQRCNDHSWLGDFQLTPTTEG